MFLPLLIAKPFRLSSALAALLWSIGSLGTAHATPPAAEPPTLEQLLQQSQAAAANEPARAVALARDALQLAQAQHTVGAELRARAPLGEARRMTSQYAEARAVIDGGLALPIAEAERAERAALRYGLAQIIWNQGDYAGAEQIYVEVQRTAEALGNRRLQTQAMNSRAIVARHEKHLPEAAAMWRAARALAESGGAEDLKLQIDNNLAVLLTDTGKYDEARAILETNLRIHTARNNRRSMANALINLGSNASAAGDETAALDYYQKALAIRLELGVPRHVASGRVAVALALAKLGRADEALAQLQDAAPIVARTGSHEISANYYAALSETHAAQGDYRSALEDHRKADQENEAVSGERTSTEVASLRERFDAEKRQREIAELRSAQERKDAALALGAAELRRTQLERYGLIAILGLGALAALAIIGRQRALARAERRILEETRRAKDVAEDAARLKSRLLDLASHDLKGPLVGVMMTAVTIAEEAADRPEIAGRAQAVHTESKRLFQVVQNLLDGSAAESGDLVLRRAPVDVAALAQEVVAELRAQAEKKSQRLTIAVEAGPGRIEADAGRLRQVVVNLVDNALKFSPAGAAVVVTVRCGERVRLEVRDQGPGLTTEDQQQLFQRFKRLSATPTGGEPSTGLGLALAHDLVARQGGRLWAESTPGAGATFIAEFPAAGQATAEGKPPPVT